MTRDEAEDGEGDVGDSDVDLELFADNVANLKTTVKTIIAISQKTFNATVNQCLRTFAIICSFYIFTPEINAKSFWRKSLISS